MLLANSRAETDRATVNLVIQMTIDMKKYEDS